MCGIIGYSGKDKLPIPELKALLLMAEARGGHSCGIATKTEIFKKAEKANIFCKRKELPTDNLVIGHTRFATTGAVNDENSHPFQTGDIVGVHNGCISNFRDLQKKEETNFNVDSEIIWHIINKYGLDRLDKLQGSAALAWIQDEQLHLYRHTNPIYIGEKKDKIYFGSSEKYLKFLECKNIRSAVHHTHYIIEDGKIIEQKKLTNNVSYYSHKRNYSWGSRNNGGRKNYNNWSGTKQYNKNRKPKDIRDKFPPRHAPADAHVVECSSDYIIYYWFDKEDPTKMHKEPIYPRLQYGIKEEYFLTKEDHLEDIRKFDSEIYYDNPFQEKLKTLN